MADTQFDMESALLLISFFCDLPERGVDSCVGAILPLASRADELRWHEMKGRRERCAVDDRA